MKSNGKNIKKGNVKKKRRVKRKRRYKAVNLYILCSVMALVAIGIIMVFSASYYDALYKHKDVFYFLLQLLYRPAATNGFHFIESTFYRVLNSRYSV